MKHIKKYESYEFYNDTLCPTFWKGFRFDERIREKLLTIAHEFYNEIGSEAKIKDIQLVGSLANYNWTTYSDLDVHIIIDFNEVNEDTELVSNFYRDRKHVWDMHHNISIQGYDVEVYVEDVEESAVSSAIYSLLNNTWLLQPKHDDPKIDKKLVFKKANVMIATIKKLQSIAESDLSPEDANAYYSYASKYKSKVMKMRKESLAEGGELAEGNLIYKVVRNFGYVDKLFDVIYKFYDKIYIQ